VNAPRMGDWGWTVRGLFAVNLTERWMEHGDGCSQCAATRARCAKLRHLLARRMVRETRRLIAGARGA
jgi:hypothetical protein